MNLIKDENGQVSSMRVAMFMCIGIAGYLSVTGLHLGSDLVQLTGLVAMFLGAGIGGKVTQKGKE
jgi:hypothetical protein